MSGTTEHTAAIDDVTMTAGTVAGVANKAQAPLRPGDEFKQYELIRELGQGGAGSVYLARDRKLGRRVAMKFLSVANEEMNERFLAEAATTAQCTHENIVVIHEIEELEGRLYMVMEYLEGETLRVSVKAGRLPVPRIAETMVPVVRALVRAHEFGIVHCDLKPANVILTRSGVIKVLDFGISQMLADSTGKTRGEAAKESRQQPGDTRTGTGSSRNARGTPRYMAPEQFEGDTIDHRADIWAVGVMLYEMAAGKHHLAGLTMREIWDAQTDLDMPVQPLAEVAPHVPPEFAALVDRCLAKRRDDRFETAQALLEELETLLPSRGNRRLAEGENPFPGLTAFQESDADRFFGRDNDVRRLTAHLRDHALVGVVGPSGVGKSSFVRAGLVPALRRAGADLEVLIARPGRKPLSALAELLDPVTTTLQNAKRLDDRGDMAQRLLREPGLAGAILRDRARTTSTELLLFVDQFEELYTLAADAEERASFVACLAAIADDPEAPLRVVVSLRSDFLDRVSEHPQFMEDLSRGLVFLRPPNRDGLIQALVEPLRGEGYRFEDEAILHEMLGALESTPGALPLLQFAASKLWAARDKKRKLLTTASYRTMGGIEGTLSSHADDVVTKLPSAAQRIVRLIFQRLVTSDGTRAIVGLDELRELSDDPAEVQRLLEILVDGRLLVVQSSGDSSIALYEIVHESLITGWPTLRQWLEENVEDSAFMRQLRIVAKQWDEKGRPNGLLWRGEAASEARHWARRNQDALPQREHDFLDAVLALAARTRRVRRGLVTGVVVSLLALVGAAAVALVLIRDAEQSAIEEAERAVAAEHTIAEKLRVIETKERARLAAERQTALANEAVAESRDELRQKNTELVSALEAAKDQRLVAEQQRTAAEVQRQQARAEAARAREAEATVTKLAADLRSEKTQLKLLLDKERARVEKLERQKTRINVGALKKLD